MNKEIVDMLLIYLTMNMLIRAITQTFVLNFSTSGLNASILFILLVPVGVYLSIIINNLKNVSKKVLGMIGFISVILSEINNSFLAVLFSILFMFSTFPLLLNSDRIIKAFIYAVGIDIAINSLFLNLNVFSLLIGKLLFTAVALIWVIFIFIDESKWDGSSLNLNLVSTYYAIFAFISFYGHTGIISTWFAPKTHIFGLSLTQIYFIKYYFLLIGQFIAFIITLYLIEKQLIKKSDKNLLILSLITIVGNFEMIFIGKISIISLPITLITYLLIYFIICDNKIKNNTEFYKLSKISFIAGLNEFLALIILFLYALAGNWAFMPDIFAPVLRGLAPFYLFMLLNLLPIYALIRILIRRKVK